METQNTPCRSNRLFLPLLTLLSCLTIASPVFAESPDNASHATCDGKEVKIEQDMSQRTLADFKVEMRSILSAKYHKKCSQAYVVRLTPEELLNWWKEADPAAPEDKEYFINEMDPKLNPTVAPFAVFVEGLPYPIVDVHRDNKLSLLLDFNDYGLSNPLKNIPECGDCGDICGQCFAEQPNRCYTVDEPDKTLLLSQIPAGTQIPL